MEAILTLRRRWRWGKGGGGGGGYGIFMSSFIVTPLTVVMFGIVIIIINVITYFCCVVAVLGIFNPLYDW